MNKLSILFLLSVLALAGFGCRKEKPNSMFAPPTNPPPADSNAPAPPSLK